MKSSKIPEKTLKNKKTIWCRIRKKDVKWTKEETGIAIKEIRQITKKEVKK